MKPYRCAECHKVLDIEVTDGYIPNVNNKKLFCDLSCLYNFQTKVMDRLMKELNITDYEDEEDETGV